MKKFEHKNKDERRRVLLSKNNELSYTLDNEKLPEGNASVQANGAGVMAKLGALTRKQLRALFAIIVAVCVVLPSMVFAAFHVKAEDTHISKDVAEVVTKKTATPNYDANGKPDGTYHVKIEAYNKAYSIEQIPTHTVLVLERSSKMTDVLYHRDYTNLKTYSTFSQLTSMPTHNDLYVGDLNPENSYIVVELFGRRFPIKLSSGISNTYKNNIYISDPNNEGVYVYLAQTFTSVQRLTNRRTGETRDTQDFELIHTGETASYINKYKYTIIDSRGNVYETNEMEQDITETIGGEIIGSGFSQLDFHFVHGPGGENDTTPGTGVVPSFSLNQANQFFQRDTDNENALNNNLWSKYTQNYFEDDGKGLYIEDEYGELCRVDIARYGRDDKLLDDSASNEDVAYFVYSMTDSKGTPFSATYGNPVYGGQYAVFQGFKKYNTNGTVNHENSVEHKTLYSGHVQEGQDVTKLLAMQEAVEDFILKVHKSAYDNDLNDGEQKIGVVSYASKTENLLHQNRLSKTEYPLTDVYNEANAYAMIKTVYQMEADGRRRIDVGMRYARDMLFDNIYSPWNDRSGNNLDVDVNPTTEQDYNVNVIAFTTGMPSKELGGDYDTTVANDAINWSRIIEAQFPKAKIYSIGMYSGADANQLYGDWFYRSSRHENIRCDGAEGSYWGGTFFSGIKNRDMLPRDAAATNRFLNYLSSNFKNTAQTIGISGPQYINPEGNIFESTGGTGYLITDNYERVSSDYYYAATEWDEVEKAFDNIAESIQVSASELHAQSVLKDTVSDYFNIKGAVTSYTLDYDGSGSYNDNNWSSEGTAINNTVSGKDITITGFDYSENYCASNHSGKKLVIEFDAEPINGFLGGHDVPTNKGASALFDDKGQLVETLPYPEVDVPLTIDLTTNDKTIYYSEETDLASLFTVSDYAKNLTNDFVDVTYNVIDPETNEVVLSYVVPAGEDDGEYSLTGLAKGDQYPVLENNKTYSIQCVLNTVDDAISERETYTKTDTASIFVYKPVFYEKDDQKTLAEGQEGVDITPTVAWQISGTEAPTTATGEDVVYYEKTDGTLVNSKQYTGDQSDLRIDSETGKPITVTKTAEEEAVYYVKSDGTLVKKNTYAGDGSDLVNLSQEGDPPVYKTINAPLLLCNTVTSTENGVGISTSTREGAPDITSSINNISANPAEKVDEINDYEISSTTDFQIVDVTIAGHSFEYETILPYYVLEDESEVRVDLYDPNTDAARKPVIITYEDEDGNPVTEELKEYDENGNLVTVYETVNKKTIISDDKGPVTDASKHYTTYVNSTSQPKTEENLGKFTITIVCDLYIDKEFSGDYANAEPVTFTFRPTGGSTTGEDDIIVNITDNDYDILKTKKDANDKYVISVPLQVGTEYTVTESFNVTEDDAILAKDKQYKTTYSGMANGQQTSTNSMNGSVATTIDESYKFTVSQPAANADLVLTVDNNDTTVIVVTGVSDNENHFNPYFIAAAVIVLLGGSGTAYVVKRKSETEA